MCHGMEAALLQGLANPHLPSRSGREGQSGVARTTVPLSAPLCRRLLGRASDAEPAVRAVPAWPLPTPAGGALCRALRAPRRHVLLLQPLRRAGAAGGGGLAPPALPASDVAGTARAGSAFKLGCCKPVVAWFLRCAALLPRRPRPASLPSEHPGLRPPLVVCTCAGAKDVRDAECPRLQGYPHHGGAAAQP